MVGGFVDAVNEANHFFIIAGFFSEGVDRVQGGFEVFRRSGIDHVVAVGVDQFGFELSGGTMIVAAEDREGTLNARSSAVFWKKLETVFAPRKERAVHAGFGGYLEIILLPGSEIGVCHFIGHCLGIITAI